MLRQQNQRFQVCAPTVSSPVSNKVRGPTRNLLYESDRSLRADPSTRRQTPPIHTYGFCQSDFLGMLDSQDVQSKLVDALRDDEALHYRFTRD
ncbi:MAG: hypothetical protein B9S37_06605 [Verrucomicrobiia bacterium Tous-C3TDCM]|nr:MAG: hypothetical protein B9S37_06605 [Verrucomicrobiae bacterium Tous-C3TDCM]PAZ04671.1 MAG: hypothetical protein CAK88_11055 [Verrucomicrobiae bacterium AMD-G2]